MVPRILWVRVFTCYFNHIFNLTTTTLYDPDLCIITKIMYFQVKLLLKKVWPETSIFRPLCCKSIFHLCLLDHRYVHKDITYTCFLQINKTCFLNIIPDFILQSVHWLYKYAIRINFCFIRTRRINSSAYE